MLNAFNYQHEIPGLNNLNELKGLDDLNLSNDWIKLI